jgi:hypothetical protein
MMDTDNDRGFGMLDRELARALVLGKLLFVHLEPDGAVAPLLVLIEDKILDFLLFAALSSKADQLLRILYLFAEAVGNGIGDGLG